MVGAIVEARDVYAVLPKLGHHPTAQLEEIGLGVTPSSDSCLVGDHDEQVRQTLCSLTQLENPRNEFEGLAMMHVASFYVDNAVSIEEQCLTAVRFHDLATVALSLHHNIWYLSRDVRLLTELTQAGRL